MSNRWMPGGKYINNLEAAIGAQMAPASSPALVEVAIIPFDGHEIQVPVNFPLYHIYIAAKAKAGDREAIEFCKMLGLRIACRDGSWYYRATEPAPEPVPEPVPEAAPETPAEPSNIILPPGV